MIEIDEIIRTRRRTIALIVQPDGRVVVRAPLRTATETIHQWVAAKEAWVIKKREQLKKAGERHRSKVFAEGETFLYLGQLYRLRIVPQQKPALSFDGEFLLSRAALPEARQAFERWYKRQALQVIAERLRRYAARFGFSYGRVRVTSARTRWGSCSAQNTLSFTWRLVMAPIEVIDYVVVHELAHTRVRNHSRKFWEEVQRVMPDFRERRAWLKKQGHSLQL